MTKIEQKIPEGWSVKKIIDVCPLQRGFDLPEQNIKKGNYPIVYSNGIKGTHNEYKATAPGVVMGRSGTIGKVTYIEQNYWPHNTSLWVTDFKDNIPKFIFYKLQKLNYAKFNSGSGVPTLNRNDVHIEKILLPPLPEQEKIAGILSCWDDGIEKLSALIEKKKIQKKALMQQLLTGKHRLKGFSSPWHEVRLGNIGMISSAGVDKKIVEGEKLVNLLNYMDVYKKDFLYTSDTSMTVSAPERQIQNCNLKKGDIFFTPSSETRDDIAHSAVVMEDITNGVYSYHIVRLRPTTPIDLKFSAYAFKTNHFYKQAFSICEGSGQRYVISQDDFRNMTVFIPSDIAEQKAIAEILSKADEEIELLNKKLEAFKQEKKALMQQLLTGKIRVKVN